MGEDKYTVLIVDDSSINRDILEHILTEDFNVYQASTGEEALQMFEEHLEEIDLCLLDVLMPGLSGFDVLALMNQRHYIDTTPVIVISGETDGTYIEKAYDLGALDYVAKPFDLRIVRRRALSTVMLFERQKELANKLREQVEASKNRKDELTGLWYYDSFFNQVDAFIQTRNASDNYCMISIDIEHFKMFNDWYGWGVGDEYLKVIAECLREKETSGDAIGGYLGGDNFAMLIKECDDMVADVQEASLKLLEKYGQVIGFMPLYGVYQIEDYTEAAQIMYDKSISARESAKEDIVNRIGRYDESKIKKTSDEMILLTDVQRGIDEKEFTFFLQPKVNMHTGKIVGAEALVRWAHKSRGIVSPGVFVDVLEDNGFITNLDRYIWEEVCVWQKKCIDSGIKPIPVSVNVSQIDIYSSDVAEYFIDLTKKYRLPPEIIEIEITESAYAKQFELISKTVHKFRQAGFKVLLDDFGSEYSSLNMLRKLEVDVLKLDMKFLDISENEVNKGVGIIESVVNMARQLDMPVIVEGVERKEQVELLTELGCNFAQGYFYYKPMPVKRFETIIKKNDVLEYVSPKKPMQMNALSVREFLDANLFSDNLLNNILGPMAFYEMVDSDISVSRVNSQYIEFSRLYNEMVDRDVNQALSRMDHKQYTRLKKIFEEAANSSTRAASGTICYTLLDNSMRYVKVRAFLINESANRKLFVGILSDETEFYNMEERIERLS